MKITELAICNYRSLDELSLSFPSSYSAICGKNNAGKTNLVRAIRVILREKTPFMFGEGETISYKEDFPMWKAKDKEKGEAPINLSMSIEVERENDAGLYKFIERFATIDDQKNILKVKIELKQTALKPENQVIVHVNDDEVDEYSAKEILKKIQSSGAILFHNSTEAGEYSRYPYRRAYGGFVSEFSTADREKFAKMQKSFDTFIGKLAKQHQKEITELLGKLEEKYELSLSVPDVNLEYLPFDMSLGDKSVSVPLKDWGSGTRNRTQILLTLFKAKKITESQDISDKITPVLIIEEPESFLHPSAQAEFGRILQDLSEEFQVQVIATTHSPYLLSMAKPESNILLQRCTVNRQSQRTEVVDTKGDCWMEPFSLALGIDNAEFEPWKQLLFSKTDRILMVEGPIDKEYFELLRDSAHGENSLRFDGEIFAYGGKDTLKNTILLRFIMDKYGKFFITHDLDCEQEVSTTFSSLKLEKGKHYISIGQNLPGKRDIEGLLPDSVRSAVYAGNPDVVQQATSAVTKERNDARGKLKQLFLSEFKAQAQPNRDYYQHFYTVVKLINKALT